MSNRYTQGRQIIRRPKVCLSPKRPQPAQPTDVCKATPDDPNPTPGQNVNVAITAYNPDVTLNSPVTIWLITPATNGTETQPTTNNPSPTGNWLFTPLPAGPQTLEFQATFADLTLCVFETTIIWP